MSKAPLCPPLPRPCVPTVDPSSMSPTSRCLIERMKLADVDLIVEVHGKAYKARGIDHESDHDRFSRLCPSADAAVQQWYDAFAHVFLGCGVAEAEDDGDEEACDHRWWHEAPFPM
jgi:hypothetical protein